MLDMSSIHVTIGVTGFSYCSIAGSSWGLICALPSVFGLLYTVKNFGTKKLDNLMVPICVASGLVCLLVFVLSPLVERYILWFLAGVLLYVVGLVFYVYDKNRWYHTIWHIIVTIAAFVHLVPFRQGTL